MSEFINWSEVSRELKCNRTAIRSNYKGKTYKDVVRDIKEIEKLIDLRIEAFNNSCEPKGLDDAINESELIDKIKEITNQKAEI